MTDEELIKLHKDMMLGVEAGYHYPPKLAQIMADRIEALALGIKYERALRIASDAVSEAAYEAAGEIAAEFVHRRLYEANMPACSYHSRDIKTAIRALATFDQLSALDRVRAEAKAEGMRMAARITRVEAERLPISLHDAALKCETAILSAIPNEFGIILGSADKLRAAIAAAKGEVI